MAKSTIFKSHRGQAVLLPPSVAFPEGVSQVDIFKVGNGRLVVPRGKRWDDLFKSDVRASSDFLAERGDLPAERREQL